jgi:hypothetical protein
MPTQPTSLPTPTPAKAVLLRALRQAQDSALRLAFLYIV